MFGKREAHAIRIADEGRLMNSSTATRPALSDEDFVRLVALIKDADSVELKLTVPESISATPSPRSGWIR